MSDPFLWSAIVSALLGAYFSVLKLSLAEFSRAEVELGVTDEKHLARIAWVVANDDVLILAAAIWRRFFAVVLMVSVLLAVATEAQESLEATLIGAAVAVLLWLYITEIGIGSAIAEHSASPVVRGAMAFLPTLYVFSKPLTMPLLWLNEVVRRLVGAEVRDELEEDLRQVVEEGEREGNISETERDMIEAIVDFRTATADEIMTPRIDIKALQRTDNLEEIKAFVLESGHSRIPVFTESVDHIDGLLYVKDLLPYIGTFENGFELSSILRDVLFVPESRRISDLLVEFQKKQIHMAVVLDEYGGTAGLVTIEDIVEEVVGEIRDEHDLEEVPEPQITPLENGFVDVDARVHIDDLNDQIGSNLPEDADYDTVGGWVFASLGRIPDVGERFEFEELTVEILEAERTHINRVRVHKRAEGDLSTLKTQEETADS